MKFRVYMSLWSDDDRILRVIAETIEEMSQYPEERGVYSLYEPSGNFSPGWNLCFAVWLTPAGERLVQEIDKLIGAGRMRCSSMTVWDPGSIGKEEIVV